MRRNLISALVSTSEYTLYWWRWLISVLLENAGESFGFVHLKKRKAKHSPRVFFINIINQTATKMHSDLLETVTRQVEPALSSQQRAL